MVRRTGASRRCTYSRRTNREGPLGHHVGAGPAKAGSALPAVAASTTAPVGQGMTDGLRPFGGFIRLDTRPMSTATRGLVLATRPARTTRATTSQDAMNRPHDRTCRPALHLPVLAQLTTQLLHERIPLTLLLDLSEPGGPNSTALLLAEGGADLTGGLCADIDWANDALLDATFGVHWTGRAQV